jgi:hypothetical protein
MGMQDFNEVKIVLGSSYHIWTPIGMILTHLDVTYVVNCVA